MSRAVTVGRTITAKYSNLFDQRPFLKKSIGDFFTAGNIQARPHLGEGFALRSRPLARLEQGSSEEGDTAPP